MLEMDQYSIEAEEDQVIRELDVFVNNDLQLYLGQFPLKPAYADPIAAKTVRFKPKHHKLELSVPYPQSVQNTLAKEQANNSIFENSSKGASDFQQKLISSEVPQQNPLMVGFIQNNNFYMCGIDNVLQFRPVMNKAHSLLKVEVLESDSDFESAVRNELDYDEDSTPNGSSSNTNNPENVKQIQLKRKESERAQSARLQSYSYLKQEEEMEPWVGLKPFPIGIVHLPYASLIF